MDIKGISSPSLMGLDTLQSQKGQKLTEKTKELSGSKDQDKIKKAATDFESLLLHQMLNSMWSTIPKNKLFGGSGNEEELYRDMYTDAVANTVSEKQSIGIRDVIMKELSKKEVTK